MFVFEDSEYFSLLFYHVLLVISYFSGKRRYSSNHSRAGDIFMMKSSHQVQIVIL